MRVFSELVAPMASPSTTTPGPNLARLRLKLSNSSLMMLKMCLPVSVSSANSSAPVFLSSSVTSTSFAPATSPTLSSALALTWQRSSFQPPSLSKSSLVSKHLRKVAMFAGKNLAIPLMKYSPRSTSKGLLTLSLMMLGHRLSMEDRRLPEPREKLRKMFSLLSETGSNAIDSIPRASSRIGIATVTLR